MSEQFTEKAQVCDHDPAYSREECVCGQQVAWCRRCNVSLCACDASQEDVAPMPDRSTEQAPTTEQVLTDHFVMLHQLPHGGPPHEWRCWCGLRFGFSETAIKHVAEALEPVLAEAWDRGRRTGTSRAMRHMSDEPHLPLAGPQDNPYLSSPPGTD